MNLRSAMPTGVVLFAGVLVSAGCGSSNESSEGELGSSAQACHRAARKPVKLYVPPPNPGAVEQILDLRAARRYADARLIGRMITTPQAVWFHAGTPRSVRRDVRNTVRRAAVQRRVPVLVAYNIPFRDCAQFSAGGATTTEEYLAWIDGFAAGIGKARAIVILEPDGLGIIPWYNPLGDRDTWEQDPKKLEWCQPAEADPDTAAAERFLQLNAALNRLLEQPNVQVYLDGTHSNWLSAGDAADRLAQAGVERAAGFFLNASNYQATERLLKYGSWISSCLAYGSNDEEGGWRLGHYEWCASQYYPADVDDFETWTLSDDWYADSLGSAVASTRFVIDTSRNGQGAWPWPAEAPEGSDVQDWCNPPDRGLGLRPTTKTRIPLVDAFLWIKIPGESDGECNRWEPWGSPDPVRGMMDPPAGEWFPEMALELVHNANPPLLAK
jgi:endoglucanase